MFVGELEGLKEIRKKGGDHDLKAAKLKYPAQVCFSPSLFVHVY